jgi:hypothetical protein
LTTQPAPINQLLTAKGQYRFGRHPKADESIPDADLPLLDLFADPHFPGFGRHPIFDFSISKSVNGR